MMNINCLNNKKDELTIDEGGNFIWLELFEHACSMFQTIRSCHKKRDGRRVEFLSSEAIDGLRPCYAIVVRTKLGKQQFGP